MLESIALVVQVLSNGVECRLQRNALAVLEPPTGNETVSRLSSIFDLNCLCILFACVQPDVHMPRVESRCDVGCLDVSISACWLQDFSDLDEDTTTGYQTGNIYSTVSLLTYPYHSCLKVPANLPQPHPFALRCVARAAVSQMFNKFR